MKLFKCSFHKLFRDLFKIVDPLIFNLEENEKLQRVKQINNLLPIFSFFFSFFLLCLLPNVRLKS